MTPRIVFEDEEIRVVHRPGGTPYSLLTFAALAHRPNDTWIWAGPPVDKLGIEALGVIARRENWYPAASMQAAAPAIRALLRPRAIGYGYSMGGYAVLKYGRLLGLTHGFAVSPQTSIDPAEVPDDRRFHRYHDPALHAGMAVTADGVPPLAFVAGDPTWPADGGHLRAAAALPGVAVIPLPFMKHAAIDRFTSSRELAAVLELVLAGDAGALRAHLRQGRSRSAELHLWLARSAEARGHGRLAAPVWARALDLGARPEKVAGARALALRERLIDLFRLRRVPEARHFVDAVIDGQGDCAICLERLGRLLLLRRMPVKASTCFRRAIEAAPRMAPAHLGLLQALRLCASPPVVVQRARAAALASLMGRPADVAAVLALDHEPVAAAAGAGRP